VKLNDSAYLIRDAYRSFRKQRYNEAYVILEQIVSSKPDAPYPYFLLAVVYLFVNKFNKSADVIAGMSSRYKDYTPIVQLEAFLNMKAAASFEAALAYYISKIEEYPNDRTLKKGAALVRAVSDFKELQREARLEDFVDIGPPPAAPKIRVPRRLGAQKKRRFAMARPSFPLPQWKRGAAALLIGAAAAAVLIVLKIPAGIKSISPEEARIVDAAEISGPTGALLNSLSSAKTREFYASTESLTADFNRARALLKSAEHNKAVLILNKISESNASFMVKEKTDFLISFIINADEREYEEIPFEKLTAEARLHRGYAVSWTGRVANLKNVNNSRSFTMLVDYKKDSFSGTVNVFYDDQEPRLENGDKIALKGVFINMLGNGTLLLKAHSVEKL
jgi:hypothetical protein